MNNMTVAEGGYTITEALAEIKTVGKRLASKREFVKKNLIRSDMMKDPLEKDGGSEKVLSQEMQAIRDLEERVVALRRSIQAANDSTKITVEGVERSITDWLVWRREVSEGQRSFSRSLIQGIERTRDAVQTLKANKDEKPAQLIVNLSEKALADEYERQDKILGQLDGLLSLKNATVMIQ